MEKEYKPKVESHRGEDTYVHIPKNMRWALSRMQDDRPCTSRDEQKFNHGSHSPRDLFPRNEPDFGKSSRVPHYSYDHYRRSQSESTDFILPVVTAPASHPYHRHLPSPDDVFLPGVTQSFAAHSTSRSSLSSAGSTSVPIHKTFKPAPMTRKSRRKFISDAEKDERYWERRLRNNEAAKRSREARREKEIEVAKRCEELETQNQDLKVAIVKLQDRNADLEKTLGIYKQLLRKANLDI